MAITITPAEPRATIDACHVAVTDLPNDRDPNGTGGPYEYFAQATADEWDGKPLKSHLFNTSAADEHRPFDGLIFPVAGTWTIDIIDTSDDSVADTDDVEVV